ncbi:unnamed protein product [Vicia faba]|uniref:C2H2-type domain-containing protein n=1 Tax=Vicia faba TaxID=3906 RepID=A0AAV0YPL9_VICFA|nr:unnamed protein product [Vicia faba]
MDCTDQKNEFHKKENRENSMKSKEKKKSLVCEVYDKPKVHHEEGSTSSKTYVCEFCNKTFSCGKGLGGHKRIHIQALKKEGLAKTKAKCKSSYNDEKQRCDVCKKDFPSKKALYGHLRSHPKREWRRVHSKKNDNYDYDYGYGYDNDDDQDQDQYFLGEHKELVIDDDSISWPPRSFKANKRGRARVFDEEVFNGAQTLMYLSRDQGFHDKLKNMDIEKKVLVVDEIDETRMRNENNKRMKLMMKLKNPCSTFKDNILMEKDCFQLGSYDDKEKNFYRSQTEIGESSQSKSRVIEGFCLNEEPNEVSEESN